MLRTTMSLESQQQGTINHSNYDIFILIDQVNGYLSSVALWITRWVFKVAGTEFKLQFKYQY